MTLYYVRESKGKVALRMSMYTALCFDMQGLKKPQETFAIFGRKYLKVSIAGNHARHQE